MRFDNAMVGTLLEEFGLATTANYGGSARTFSSESWLRRTLPRRR
jgi:hypothetical protein